MLFIVVNSMRLTTILVGIIVVLILFQGMYVQGSIVKNSKSDSTVDSDCDCVSDDYEYSTYNYSYYGIVYKLNPYEYDSWYDGLSDGQKVAVGLVDRVRAMDSDSWKSMAGDLNGDGLRDDIEVALGLDPLSEDTDMMGLWTPWKLYTSTPTP